jgi:hypothetical protein
MSLDELLLVQGMTPEILYGTDRNRNGQQDPGEPTDVDFSRGLIDYLTIYGREVNVDSTGAQRTSLNSSDLVTLNQTLAGLVGQQMADYIVAYRMFSSSTIGGSAGGSGTGSNSSGSSGTGTSSTTSGSSGGNSMGTSSNSSTTTSRTTVTTGTGSQTATATTTTATVTGTATDLRNAVQQALAGTPQSQQTIKTSVLTLYNTQVTLPRPANATANTPTTVIPCPLNTPATFTQLLPTLLDKTTARSGYEITPRLDVSQASPDVMAAILIGLGGLTQDDANNATAAAPNLTPGDPATTTAAWLVTQGGISPSAFIKLEPYVTGFTQTYRVQSLGYFASGGPVARMEAVIDTNQGQPRIIYFRDLSDLGAGFTPPR